VSLGDDETITTVQSLCGRRDTQLSIRNWLKHLEKDIATQWRKTTGEWPEPMLAWSGLIEELHEFSIDGESYHTAISLWRRRQEDPTDTSAWGGAFVAPSMAYHVKLLRNPRSEVLDLSLPGRTTARILLSGGAQQRISFIGTGPYPQANATNGGDGSG